MRPITLFAVVFLAAPVPARAQVVIDPGMSQSQVIAKLGHPAVQKSAAGATFLFYRNGAEHAVGMSDVVILEGDKVTDAVFRSKERSYSGKSSSPSAIPAAVARRHPPIAAPDSAPKPARKQP